MLQNIYFVTYIQRKWLLKLRHKETRYETKEEKKVVEKKETNRRAILAGDKKVDTKTVVKKTERARTRAGL